MANPSTFGLRENPFGNVPGAEVKNWAGLQKTKQMLSDIVLSVRPDDIGSKEAVILLGDYGAGKSHALRYFTNAINEKEQGLAIYISDIRSSANITFTSLYPRIIGQIGEKKMDALWNNIHDAVSAEGKKMQADRGMHNAKHDTVVNMVMDEKVSEIDKDMLRSLYEKRMPPTKVADDFAATKALASLFRVMTTSIGDSQPPYPAVYLFLDEVESIWECRAPQQVQFFGAIRSLINEVTEHFALVLSFSAPMAVIESAIPDSVQRRLTRPPYECPTLESEGAKEFAKDYLGFIRREGYEPSQPFYPFSEDAMDSIFERETSLVPSKILDHMRAVFERSVRREGLEENQEITREMAEKILEERGM